VNQRRFYFTKVESTFLCMDIIFNQKLSSLVEQGMCFSLVHELVLFSVTTHGMVSMSIVILSPDHQHLKGKLTTHCRSTIGILGSE
jgi:hypothetical protein